MSRTKTGGLVVTETTKQQPITNQTAETFQQIAERLNAVCKGTGAVSGLAAEDKAALQVGEEIVFPVTLTGYKPTRIQANTNDTVLPVTWKAVEGTERGTSNYNEILRDGKFKVGDTVQIRLTWFKPEKGSGMVVAVFSE